MPQELYEEIERADKMPIVIDDECPELTLEAIRFGLFKPKTPKNYLENNTKI